MAKKDNEEYAKRNGVTFLAEGEVELQVKLTNEDRIEFGKIQSDALAQIDKVMADMQEKKAAAKAKIEELEHTIGDTAEAIRSGKRKLNRKLPYFLDRKGMVVFIDIESGEECYKRAANEKERQMSLA